MKFLFIHPNFPGQFKHVVRHFASNPYNTVVFACSHPNHHINIPGVKRAVYRISKEPSKGVHHYLQNTAKCVYAGQEMWRLCKKLKEEGFVPDVIVAHPGWGEAMYVKDIFYHTPLLNYFEFFYQSYGADVNFKTPFGTFDTLSSDDEARIRSKNMPHLINLYTCDWGMSPTFWQMSRHPKEFHQKISVIHDGIDTGMVKPRERKRGSLTLPNKALIKAGEQIITYMTRNFESYRGFETMMRAVEIMNKERPDLHIVLVGQNEVSYGKQAPEPYKCYLEMMLDKITLTNRSRVHIFEKLPYQEYLTMLQYSSCHVYLTLPFVLSWSMVEAMAAGCAIVASDTKPVTEVIKDGYNGLLVDFFDHEGLTRKIFDVLDHEDNRQDLRKAARKTALDHYNMSTLLPLQIELITDLAKGQLPPQAHEKISTLHAKHVNQSTLQAA